jgi:hypothetical protein
MAVSAPAGTRMLDALNIAAYNSDDETSTSTQSSTLPSAVLRIVQAQKERAQAQAARARAHTNNVLGVLSDGSFAVKTTDVLLQEQRYALGHGWLHPVHTCNCLHRVAPLF